MQTKTIFTSLFLNNKNYLYSPFFLLLFFIASAPPSWGQNSCSSPSSPLATPSITNVQVLNCTTIVVTANTNITTNGKSFRFQVYNNGTYSSTTGVYCNTSNMNACSGSLYYNNITTAVYGVNSCTLTLCNPLPAGTVKVIARVAITGNHSLYSSPYSFAVTYPSINNQPQNDTICSGQTASYSIGASGSNLSYQWQIISNGNFANILGATSVNYYISLTTPGTYFLRCNISNTHTCNFYSNQATLTVLPTMTTPTSVSATDGSSCTNVTVTWNSVSGASSYTIRKNGIFVATVTGTSWTDNSASTSSTLYEVRANNGSCSSAYVGDNGYRAAAPVFSTQPSSQTVCAGATSVTFSVSVNNSGVWKRNGVSLGISSTTLTINNPTTADQGNYVYEATNGCGTTSSNTATLSITTPPSPNYNVIGITMIGQTITLQAQGTGNHSWTITKPSGTILSFSTTNPSFVASERGTYQIFHSVGNLGCTASITSTLDITPNYSLNRPVEASRNIEYVADPVNSASGEFKYSHSMVSVSALGTNLDFGVFYTSQHLVNNDMGYGWSHNWRIRMVRLSSPSGDLYVEFGDGSRIHFTEYTGTSPRILPSYSGVLDTLINNNNGTYSLQTPLGEAYLFDNNGKLLSVSDLNGNSFSLAYSSGLLTRVTAPGGRYLDFVYNGSNKLIMVSNQMSDVVAFSYFNNDLVQLLNLNMGLFSYVYDGTHRLLEIRDPRNIRFIQNTYDAQNRITKQKMADNGEFNIAYDVPTTRATTVTDPGGNNRVYYYDANWNLVRELDEEGFSEYIGYNNKHLMNLYVNQQGDSTHFTYDQRGNIILASSPMGKQVQSTFTSLNQPSNITNSLGISTGLVYDAAGNLIRINLPNTGQINLLRNSNGTISSMTDAEGRVLTYTFSPQGDITNIATPTGNIVMTYNAIGRLLTLTDQNGKTTSFTYDTYGNVLRVTNPSASYVESAYDANGNLISFKDKAGNYSYFAYNNKDELVSITDAMGRVATITLNLLNQITRVDYSNGGYIEYTYTPRGSVATSSSIHGTVTNTYDSRGLLIATSFPNSYILNYSYDKDGFLIAYGDNLGKTDSLFHDQIGRVHKTKNSLGVETIFTLNDMGNLVGVAHAGIANSTYNVNLNGEMLSVANPNGHITSNSIDTSTGRINNIVDPLSNNTAIIYDNVGNIISISFPNGNIETRTYDDDYNLISRSWSNGYYENYTLNANDEVIAIATPDGVMNFDLNANSEITSISDQYGNTIDYAINTIGLPDTIDVNGRIILKTYNTLGQEQTTTDWENDTYTSTYNTAGFQDRFDYPNDVKRHLEYRMDGHLMDITYTNVYGDTIFYQQFLRDLFGNVLSENKPTAFIPVIATMASETYSYLANDAQSNSGYNSDVKGHLTNFPDGLGNTVIATYDQKDRLATLQIGARTINNYYDVGNFLVKQVDNGIEKRFIWDYAYGLPRIIAETDAMGNLISSYIWANGLLVSRINELSGQKLFYITDANGNVVALTDSLGNVTDTYTYGLDGEAMQHTGTTQQPFTWRGGHGVLHQFGSIYYVRQRWHDAASGRFLSQDPYPSNPLDNQTLNRYVYGLNNPLSYVDVNGLYAQGVAGCETMSASKEYHWIREYINPVVDILYDNPISTFNNMKKFVSIGQKASLFVDKFSKTRKWVAKTSGYGAFGVTKNFLKSIKPIDGIDVAVAAYRTDMVQNFLYKQTPETFGLVNKIVTDQNYRKALSNDAVRVANKLKNASWSDYGNAIVPALKATINEAVPKIQMVGHFAKQFSTNLANSVVSTAKSFVAFSNPFNIVQTAKSVKSYFSNLFK